MLDPVANAVQKAIEQGLLIDGFVSHTGDDIAILASHTRGADSIDIHQPAWKSFLDATAVAQKDGLYGAGQDLLVDAPSGNIRGAGVQRLPEHVGRAAGAVHGQERPQGSKHS